jgi:hypothetical protein
MRCYFLSGGHIVAVEILDGLLDEAAVAKAHELYAERKALYEGFEVWDRARVVIRHSGPRAGRPSPKAAQIVDDLDRQGQP